MKKTTEAMHRGLGRAVKDLRTRMDWDQGDLAEQMTKAAAKMGLTIKPNQVCVSRWETGESAPSEPYRVVLAKVAAKNRHEDLAEFFRAPVSVWRIVGLLRDQG